jgi:hypothetical protein
MDVIYQHLSGIRFVLDKSIEGEVHDKAKINLLPVKAFIQMQQTNKIN